MSTTKIEYRSVDGELKEVNVLVPLKVVRKKKDKEKKDEAIIERKTKNEEKKEFDSRLSKIYNEWFEANDTEYIIHVGKTGSGKTYSAVQRLKQAGSGVYLAPLRLLAWQVYDDLNESGFPCRLITGEEQLENKEAKMTSSTIEMLDYSKYHDTVIVDEAFMIADEDRGKAWLKAILRVRAREVNIITNHESLGLITSILTTAKRKHTHIEYKMLQSFKFTETPFVIRKAMPDKGVFVTFSRIDVLIHKMRFEELGKNVSVLYGNLPPEVKKRQIESFISGETQLMVCTDVIGMGINVPCDYIVFLEVEKFDGKVSRNIKPIEVRQISGRTGRYGLSHTDSFVSATKPKHLHHIKASYGQAQDVNIAYFGFDFDIFASLPDTATIGERITYFTKAKIIPSKVSDIIKKESVAKYFDIAILLVKYKFDLETQWIFLTAPMKLNNKDYFIDAIRNFNDYQILKRPVFTAITGDAKYLEDLISEFELYLNLTRSLPYDDGEKEKIMEIKPKLVDELQRVLLDKRLSSKKKCKLCPTLLKITHPYPYCNDCYVNKIRSQYDNHSYDYNDDYDTDEYFK